MIIYSELRALSDFIGLSLPSHQIESRVFVSAQGAIKFLKTNKVDGIVSDISQHRPADSIELLSEAMRREVPARLLWVADEYSCDSATSEAVKLSTKILTKTKSLRKTVDAIIDALGAGGDY